MFLMLGKPGVTKRCRLFLLTNSALVIRVQMRDIGVSAESQPMSTAVHITLHGAQINFGDLTPYLTYVSKVLRNKSNIISVFQCFIVTLTVFDIEKF